MNRLISSLLLVVLTTACANNSQHVQSVNVKPSTMKNVKVEKADQCQDHIGTKVSSTKFSTLSKRFEAMNTTKGEYETTALYKKQLGNVGVQQHFIEGDFRGSYVKYDVDSQKLTIPLRKTGDHKDADYSSLTSQETALLSSDNVDVVLGMDEELLGSYWATNGFGATFEVFETNHTYRIVFDRVQKRGNYTRAVDRYTRGLFQKKDLVVSATPEIAKSLRAGKMYLSMTPKFPFYGESKSLLIPRFSATDVAIDGNLRIQALIADIQCALYTDKDNTVLFAVETN